MANDVRIKQVPLTFEYRADSTDPYRANKLTFEMDDRVDENQVSLGTVRIRRYPYTLIGSAPPLSPIYDSNGDISGWSYGAYSTYNYGVNLIVSQGSLVLTNEIRQKFVSETVFISGEESIELPYPVLAGLKFFVLGNWYGINGAPLWQVGPFGSPLVTPWPIIFDLQQQRLTFGQPVFGQLRYEYWTDYQIYRYTPTYVGDYELFCTSGADQYGYIMTFPLVTEAGKVPETEIFSIRPPEPLNFEFELYRLTSEAVATSDGLWEKPDNFPSSGSFPGSTEVLDYTQGYMLVERVHEIGMAVLHNQERQARNAKSTSYAPLPTDLGQQIRKGLTQQGDLVGFARTIDGYSAATSSNASKAPKDYFRNIKDIPRANLRTVRYEVRPGKPYENATAGTEKRYVIRQVLKQNGQVVEDVSWENTSTYKIKMKLQVGREPTYDGAFRSADTLNDYQYNAQAAQVNAMLRRLWQAVDWAGVKKIVEAAYPAALYDIDYTEITPLIP